MDPGEWRESRYPKTLIRMVVGGTAIVAVAGLSFRLAGSHYAFFLVFVGATVALLFAADRTEHAREMEARLEAGEAVICDPK